jgi:hypothetical protein
MPTIGQVLNRRTDLSTFVVHLTRASGKAGAFENLEAILRGRRIAARTPMGWAARAAVQLGPMATLSQSVVCFSETPLEQVYGMYADIPRRQVKLEPFGLAFTKMTARRHGVNPVWYVDMTPGHRWRICEALDLMRDRAVAIGDDKFAGMVGAVLLPFVEGMGTWEGSQKEFWWEREWRHVGDLTFADQELAFVIAPAAYHDVVRTIVDRPCLDPEWSLERMIASLAGLTESDVTPFTV